MSFQRKANGLSKEMEGGSVQLSGSKDHSGFDVVQLTMPTDLKIDRLSDRLSNNESYIATTRTVARRLLRAACCLQLADIGL